MKDKLKSQQASASSSAKTLGRSSAASAKSASGKSGSDLDESFDFLAPPQNKDELGRLSHYRILKVLGRGGMGVVFRAEDSRLHRQVALKVMLPSVAKKYAARDRFKREALVTAKIEHDHIVTIYEVNEEHDLPFLAMQLLKGMTLDEYMRTGRKLKMSQIIRIGKEIAKGLSAAHACELIHRDIKPSNIWLDATNKGRVKILDFGLARPTNEEETELTHQGTILGTPAFMSPEQARGQQVDARSDLFSLGCVLYRLCAGRLPFNGPDVMAVLYAISNEDPPPVENANPEVPAGFANVIHELLEKDPADRPQSAHDVAQTLQQIEREWAGRDRTLAHKPQAVTDIAPGPAPVKETEPATLEESALSEQDLTLPSVTESPAKSKWLWAAVGIGSACVLLFVLAIAVVVGVWFFSGQGQVRMVAADIATRTRLREVGVTLSDQNNTKYVFKDVEQRLPPGNYVVDVNGLPEGLVVEPHAFTLRRGESLELKVHLVTQEALLERLEKLSNQQVTSANAKKLQQEWAQELKCKVEEPNTIGITMVVIPAGVFSMGSKDELVKQQTNDVNNFPPLWKEKERYVKLVKSEAPEHSVHITRPFALGKYEVTVGQFERFVSDARYTPEMDKNKPGGTGVESGQITRRGGFTWNRNGFMQAKDAPVSNVTWADAEAFCRWLSEKEKKFYRLPTEAEWEFACRAGTTAAWSFGNKATSASDYMWHLQPGKVLNPNVGPQPIGKKKPNPFGLFDMHGNVEEMCSDIYSADYYAKCPHEDPTGPHEDAEKEAEKPKQPMPPFKGKSFPFGKGGKHNPFDRRPPFPPPPGKGKQPDPSKEKVARGGSFMEIPQVGRSAFRNAYNPTLGYVQVGFRVVCELSLPD